MPNGRVVAIQIAKRGLPMQPLTEVRAVAGKGLEGDRYYDKTGTYSAKVDPALEVTLIEAEAIEAIKHESKIDLPFLQTRRNIVTRSVALNHFVGREFMVGELKLRGWRLCEPCGHMERLAGKKGACAALVHRGGLRCQILEGGMLRIGDEIRECAPPVTDADETRRTQLPAAAALRPLPEPGKAPRPEATTIESMEFCCVPAGAFTLGSQNDPLIWDAETPQLSCDIAYDYWMARYPITNAQFREFVQADAYRDPSLWKEAIDNELWKQGLLKNKASETPLFAPDEHGAPFDRADHPIVGVTWYEALAFARWLNRRLKESGLLPAQWEVGLPSEIEWEKAARGGAHIPVRATRAKPGALNTVKEAAQQANPLPKRRFPWGDDPDAARANYVDTSFGSTCAVGTFPTGASPYGIEDLAGNTWEWTRSMWYNYPYPAEPEARQKREGPGPNGARTLRGGSFELNVALVRCASRHCERMSARYRDVGFRVALLPAK
jgi:formylglycine-generating enzyme required for sulfatase activity